MERGAILLMVLIVVLSISLLGATLMAIFFNVLTTSSTELYRAQALYLAEAGIAQAMSLLKNGEANTATQMIPATPLGEGFFEVENDFSQSTLVSVGESHGVRRVIQLKYNAF